MTHASKRSDFKAKVLPNIEPLLQVSLWLTRNGLDASRLMREALTEAYQSWNLSAPAESYSEWLRMILINRYAIGMQQHVRLSVPGSNDGAKILVESSPNTVPETGSARLQSWLAGNSGEDVSYFEAVASLPDVCRSAMILTCLEGFSNAEITDVTDVQSGTIDSVPSRGRRFIREEIFEHLMGRKHLDGSADRKAASACN